MLPDLFWKSTIREAHLMCTAHINSNTAIWEAVRQIDYAIKTAAFVPNCMGKKGSQPVYKSIKKPTDLFQLPNDKRYNKPVKIDKERTIAAVNKAKKIWQEE